MQNYITANLRNIIEEGDIIVARDNKFVKCNETTCAELKYVRGNTEDTYIGEVKEYVGNPEIIYIVTKVQNNAIKIKNLESGEEQFIKRDKDMILEIGDFIKTKSNGYEKYEQPVNIKSEKIEKEIKNLYDNIF